MKPCGCGADAWSPPIRAIVVELPDLALDARLLPDDDEAEYRVCTSCEAGARMVSRAVNASPHTRGKGLWQTATIIGQGQWIMLVDNPDAKMPEARA